MPPQEHDELMRVGAAARYLGMSVVGVRKAALEGRLAWVMSGGGHRLFKKADLDAYLGRVPAPQERPRREALYCRVSGSSGQASSLERQEALLRDSASGEIAQVYRDRASGLNERRQGLTRLLNDAAQGRFTVVRVTHADRLSRFGVPYLERCLAAYGVTLEVLHPEAEKSLHDELMADFMALVASFSGRFYRLRSRENQGRLLKEALDGVRTPQE